LTADDLRAFEAEVIEAFKAKRVRGPVHLGLGSEEGLLNIWAGNKPHPDDWIFATYRAHYAALLHGVPRDKLMDAILAGRSMTLMFPEHRFYCSAIVGGMLPVAVGVAAALNRAGSERKVWCFVGDMAASTGGFADALRFASGHGLPLRLYVENNRMSCDSPTDDCWGVQIGGVPVHEYRYKRQCPHVGVGEFVHF